MAIYQPNFVEQRAFDLAAYNFVAIWTLCTALDLATPNRARVNVPDIGTIERPDDRHDPTVMDALMNCGLDGVSELLQTSARKV